MSFDLGPAFRDAAGDGQLYNSEYLAPEEYYNCTWEALRQTARAYGFTGYDDAQLRATADRILARGDYNYGERWETNLAVAEELWLALSALMSIQYPNDVVAAIKEHGEAGRRVHCGFWCDSAAWVPPQGTVSYSHALMSLAGDEGGVWWVNPEPHPDVYLSDDSMRSLYDGGGLLVFEPLPAAVPLLQPSPGDAAMALIPHPTAKRFDMLWTGTDGGVWHTYGVDPAKAANGLLDNAPDDPWGRPGGSDAMPGTLSACWDLSGVYLHVTVADTAGQVWMKVLTIQGAIAVDWTKVPNVLVAQMAVRGPAGPAGPAGPPGAVGPAGKDGGLTPHTHAVTGTAG